MNQRSSRSGFSRVEFIALLGALVVILAILFVIFGRTTQRPHQHYLRDASQIRGLHMGLLMWAASNKDNYPLPSLIDLSNATVRDVGPAKDHTANILSPLIFNGTISTDILISPQEASPKIHLMDSYEFDEPKAAADPAHALWDPALSADFTSATGGHISYAHMLPSGNRLGMWSGKCPASAPVMGNRGPEVSAVAQSTDASATPTFASKDSITFLIHGSRTAWEGYMAFADNHVEFLAGPKVGKYTDGSGKSREDVLFYDEPDDSVGTNTFLGIFTKAGPTPAAFKAIWD